MRTLASSITALIITSAIADKSLTLTATLKDDGTLAGCLSGPIGDMWWTGTRSAALRP